jgi:hypothetical protein
LDFASLYARTRTALKVPNFIRHFQTCVNHPSFPPSQAHQKQGPFPPPALPGFLGTSGPFRRPDGPPPLLATFAVRDSRDHHEPPPLTLDYLSGMLYSLPRWTR